MVKNISNLGDAAVYCDFGSEVNETINASVIDYFHHISKLIKDKKIEGITNLTPSYNKLISSFSKAYLSGSSFYVGDNLLDWWNNYSVRHYEQKKKKLEHIIEIIDLHKNNKE